MVSRIRLFVILVIVSTATGIVEAYLSPHPAEKNLATAMLHNGVIWFLGSMMVWGFEVFLIPSRYGIAIRQLYFLTAIAVKSVILVMIVVVLGMAGRAFFHDIFNLEFLVDPLFYRTMATVFAVVIPTQIAVQIIRIIGGRTLIYFVLGKYHRPVREDRIFMFLDIAGSTALAEKLGDVGVQTMITKFFFDITEPIIEHGGEIHRYVGDQVVVTWPLGDGDANLRAIRCCFAIKDYLGKNGFKYEREFGIVPSYRIGLHGGPVVISQCGDQKQEISYFGDTVNTAARIEQQCKALDCPLLISAELLERITLPPAFRSLAKGRVQLRGRANETELFTIEAVAA